MLTNELGIRLILWMGSTVPLPAPMEVIQALDTIEVTNDKDAGDGFQMNVKLVKDQTLDYGLLKNSALTAKNRVVIAVLIGVVPEVLIDGLITHQQVKTGDAAAPGQLTITGKDVGAAMDLEEKNAEFKNQTDSVIALRIILQYAQYGLIPAVTPTFDVPIEVDKVPKQAETDLAFLKRLAERNGFVFYIEPVTLGVNKAYWGVENRLGLPQPALSQDMGSMTNVKSLSFSQDALEPVSTEGVFVEPFFKLALPIPSLPSLAIPPLALSPVSAVRKVKMRDTASQGPATAATRMLAVATNAPLAVTGEGEVDTIRYGSILRARRLVGVRGAGLSYDGFYTVQGVTHKVARGEFTQRFKIAREGTGTTTPVVVP